MRYMKVICDGALLSALELAKVVHRVTYCKKGRLGEQVSLSSLTSVMISKLELRVCICRFILLDFIGIIDHEVIISNLQRT